MFGKPNIKRMLEKRDIKGLFQVASKSWKYEELAVQASEALVTIGVDAVEPLTSILEDANKSDRWRARFRASSQVVSQILGRIGDARAVKPLIDKLSNPVIRWHVANALWMIGEEAFGPLTKALENFGDEERAYVVDVAKRAFVEKKGVAPTPQMGISDSPKALTERWVTVDSSGKIEITNANFNALFGESFSRTVAKEKELHKQPEPSDAQKFVCSVCGEEIPNAVRYEPPDLTMRCSGIARQCSCGWTCCLRCDPTYDQSDNGHDCPQCGQRRTGWVHWDPNRNMVDRSGWIQIDGETDHWFRGGLWRKWKENRASDRWTSIQRALAKRLNL